MSAQRLYKAEWVHEEGMPEELLGLEDWERELLDLPETYEPEGWREYAIERWGTEAPEREHWPNGYKPFFWPSTDRIFRSRSAAQRRVDIINHWGGKAVLVECTPQWETVDAANRRRKARRIREKRARVIAQLDAVNAELVAVEAVAS